MTSSSDILEFWNRKVETEGTTIKDLFFRDLQVEAINSYLKPTDHLLDPGCGNGDNVARYSEVVARVTAVDFSPSMIRHCQAHHPSDRVRYQVGDIKELPFDGNTFDVVVIERTLINLTSLKDQTQALREAIRVLKPGHLCLLGEVSERGHQSLNEWRSRFGIEPLERHWHNLPLDEERLLASVQDVSTVEHIVRFSTYEFISKVLYPVSIAPEEPQFGSKVNELAAEISREYRPDAFGDLCKRSLYVLRKHE